MNENYWQTVGVTGYNSFSVPETEGETNYQPSETIPDHNMTMREIVSRYTRGLPVNTKVPIWDGEDEFRPDPRSLDLTEIAELKQQAAETIQKYREAKM